MSPTWPESLVGFASLVIAFTSLGLPFARRVLPTSVPALAAAPALGWALFNVMALPALSAVGFSRGTIALCLGTATLIALALARQMRTPARHLPHFVMPLAAVLAWLPAVSIMPKPLPAGLLVAPPLFDHVKIAVIDAILRDGLPVPNPFVGDAGRGTFAYYYLWHFAAALWAKLSGLGGWTMDAAQTAFTAYASLGLVAALASGLGGGGRAIALAFVLIIPGTAHPVLDRLGVGIAASGDDLPGWLNQAAWVPQHLASASCMVLAVLLMVSLAREGGWLRVFCLGAVVAAGFETSALIGGIAMAVGGTGAGLWLLRRHGSTHRLALFAAAALLTAFLICPFAAAELAAATSRGTADLAFAPLSMMAPGLRAFAPVSVPLFLLVMFPALLPFAFAALGPPGRLRPERDLGSALFIMGVGCLSVTLFLRSTIANNDLGWRAMLPVLLATAALAGCAADRLSRAPLRLGMCAALALLGVPDSVRMMRDYLWGWRPGDPTGLATAATLWPEIRTHTAGTDRILNNPGQLAAVTPWPVNLGWALFSDRPSCYAGWASVVAYGSFPQPELIATNAAIYRIFAGVGTQSDLARLNGLNCRFVLLTPSDGAWAHDPFAVNPTAYTPVAFGPAFRLYRRAAIARLGASDAVSAPASELKFDLERADAGTEQSPAPGWRPPACAGLPSCAP